MSSSLGMSIAAAVTGGLAGIVAYRFCKYGFRQIHTMGKRGTVQKADAVGGSGILTMQSGQSSHVVENQGVDLHGDGREAASAAASEVVPEPAQVVSPVDPRSGGSGDASAAPYADVREGAIVPLITYERFLESYSIPGYRCETHPDDFNRLGFIQFKRDNSGDVSGVHKLHVSVKETQENFRAAFNVIIPIILKFNVAIFKVIYPKKIGESGLDSNICGKEFVIYHGDVKDQAMLLEIERGFLQNGVLRGPHSKGDSLIFGSQGFWYTRAAYNMFRQYVAADCLQMAGFTSEEAAHIGTSPWFGIKLSGSVPEAERPAPQQPMGKPEHFDELVHDSSECPRITILAEQIHKKMRRFLNENRIFQEETGSVQTGLLTLTSGSEHQRASRSYFELELALFVSHAFDLGELNIGSNSRAKFYQCPVKKEFLEIPIKLAAQRVAWILRYLEKHHGIAISSQIEIGQILPAVFSLIQEYYDQNKSPLYNPDFWGRLNDAALQPRVIQSLIRCALRTSCSQIGNSEPTYQFRLNASVIQALVEASDSISLSQ
jgi:hypothetical protein